MKFSLFSLLFLLKFVASEEEIVSDVVELNNDNFEEVIKENQLVLTEFFAPWCGHCKSLAPEYAKAATQLKDDYPGIKLTSVDCTVYQSICTDYGIEGFPTLKLFRDGSTKNEEAILYRGDRTAESIVAFLMKQTLPSISILNTDDAAEHFINSNGIVTVAFINENDKESNETFTNFANKYREEYIFGAINNKDIAKKYGITKFPSLVLFKDFDEGKIVYPKNSFADLKDVENFIKTESTPLIGTLSPSTYRQYVDSGKPIAYLFHNTDESREELIKTVKPIAEKFKGKLNFVTLDATKFGQHANNLRLVPDQWPAFAIQDVVKSNLYPLLKEDKSTGKLSNAPLTAKAISRLAGDVVSGKAVPYRRSDPIPTDNGDSAVKVIVGKNFEEVVYNSDKAILVEFYAPWCGHCKNLAPKYEELAVKVASEAPEIIIAKIDASNNDTPETIEGYPTILFYPANDKKNPITYSGDRTVDSLFEFVIKNSQTDDDTKKDKSDDVDHDEL